MGWKVDTVFSNGDAFVDYLKKYHHEYIKKHISAFHVHHTYIPDHEDNKDHSTLTLHKNIRHFHEVTKGWGDIAQHITNGYKGDVVSGKSVAKIPFSSSGSNGNSNWHPFMVENIGNFDAGHDKLEGEQLESLCAVGHYLCIELGKPLKFHNDLTNTKSCPGTGISKNWLYSCFKDYGDKPEVKNLGGNWLDKQIRVVWDKKDDPVVIRKTANWKAPVYYDGYKVDTRRQILGKYMVDGSPMFRIKGSDGDVYYVTAVEKYVVVESKEEYRMAQNLKNTGFKDVSKDHQLVKEIKKANKAKIAFGYGDDNFKPDQPITRAEAVAFAVRAVETATGVELPEE